jgi:small subunit ribosomal protein S23
MKYETSTPARIRYVVDPVRKQFYRDFPFEAFRPATLVEGREIEVDRGIEGAEWRSLEQRGAYPTPERLVWVVGTVRLSR